MPVLAALIVGRSVMAAADGNLVATKSLSLTESTQPSEPAKPNKAMAGSLHRKGPQESVMTVMPWWAPVFRYDDIVRPPVACFARNADL